MMVEWDLLSRLQSSKQIQPGSPLLVMRIVRLTTLDMRVAQLPTKVLSARVRILPFP